MTTPEGLQYALSLLRKKGSGIPVVHAALPCTWGSSMQSLHKKRLQTDKAYRKHMDDLYKQFEDLMFNFMELASEVKRRKGGIVFEWPANNKLWKEESVEALIRVFGLTKVNFNGCQFGLVTRKGKAICKPWTFATNIPCVVEMFSPF